MVSWKSLMNMNIVCSNRDFHYKTINKIHLEWARNGVYEKAFNRMLKTTENCNITQNNYIDGSIDKLCLSIDTFSKNRRFFRERNVNH